MKTRMQVLAAYFEPTIEYDNEPSKDMQLAITLNPDLRRIDGAMEEYAEQAVKLALEKAAAAAQMVYHDGYLKVNHPTKYHQSGPDNLQIDKSSILAITPASIINEIENTVKE